MVAESVGTGDEEMAENAVEIAIKAQDQASAVLREVGTAGEQAAANAETQITRVGEASEAASVSAADVAANVAAKAAVVGGTITSLVNHAEAMNESLRRTAIIAGYTNDELRRMVLSITNVTFSNESAVRGMDALIKAGVESKEQFEALLPVFDTFGDATGIDMTDGIKAFNAVLSAMGIPLDDAAEHLDTFTFLTQKTTVSLDKLGMLMRREAVAMKEMSLSTEDIAVAMAALEYEGIKGPRAIMVFQTAMKEAGGSVEAFWQNLTVSSKVLDEQRQRLADSAGLTDELAASNTASLTIWDYLQYRIDGVKWSIGSFLKPVQDLGPVLIGLGGILTVLPPIITSVTAAVTGLTAAKMLLFAKVIAVIAIVAAVGLAIRHLWETNETFRAVVIQIWDTISKHFEEVMTAIKAILSGLTVWIQVQLLKIQIFWTEWGDEIMAVVNSIFEIVGSIVKIAVALIGGILKIGLALISGDWSGAWEAMKTMLSGIFGGILDIFVSVVGVWIAFFGETWTSIQTVFSDALQTLYDATIGRFRDIVSEVGDAMSGIVEVIAGPLQRAYRRAKEIARNIKEALDGINPFSRSSPSLVDNVQSGVDAIIEDYKRLEGLKIQAPKILGAEAFGVTSGTGGLEKRRDPGSAATQTHVHTPLNQKMHPIDTPTETEVILELDGLRLGRVLLPLLRRDLRRMNMRLAEV